MKPQKGSIETSKMSAKWIITFDLFNYAAGVPISVPIDILIVFAAH